MDLNDIKKLIETEGGKIIIVENGEPVMVVVSFGDWQKNKGKAEVKPQVKTPKPLPKELAEDDLKIEDLPL